MPRFARLPNPPRLPLLFLMAALCLTMVGCNLDYVGLPTLEAIVSGSPVVTIASPLPDAVFVPGVEVVLQARISNAGPGIAQVEARIDGEPVLTLADPNPTGAYAFSIQETWTATNAGPHTLAVTATRADGTVSEPVSVAFSVTGAQAGATATTGPTATAGVPILPIATTPAPAATTAPPTSAATPAPDGTAPIATFAQTLNVRSGPGLAFNPPIGSFSAGQTAEVLARNSAGDWLKVRYFDGEGWVFAELAAVTGDMSRLPVDDGPATPASKRPARTAASR